MMAAVSALMIVSVTAPVAGQTLQAIDRHTLAGPLSMLPSATQVWVSPNGEITSSNLQEGGRFDVTVTRDVMLGDYIVIPRGTPGHGSVTWRTGRGVYGKSAKMEFDLTDIVIDGTVVPIAGHYRLEGQGNTGATLGVAVAAGVIAAAFVTGHSATAPQNSEWKAYTLAPLKVAYNTDPASSPYAGLSPYEQGRRAGQAALLASAAR
jgi:hypothetical protein